MPLVGAINIAWAVSGEADILKIIINEYVWCPIVQMFFHIEWLSNAVHMNVIFWPELN